MMSTLADTGRRSAAMGVPANAAVPRRVPSIRRTSHIDMQFTDDTLELHGAARDLATLPGRTADLGHAEVDATVAPDGRLTDLTAEPSRSATASLAGLVVRGGFRDAVAAALPDEVAAGTPLALLLDDLPVASLISGYALLYRDAIPAPAADFRAQEDICSGWRREGTMMVSVRAGAGVPVTVGPPALSLDDEIAIDDLGWHRLPPLPVGAMRRRRLVDVHIAESWNITAMFRDTHVDEDGDETVLHEYSLTATVDPQRRTFTSCAAVPRVLPWAECPVAAASADRLVGRGVNDVRDVVRSELRGTSTCTHLNDLLRSLGDVGTLAAALERQI